MEVHSGRTNYCLGQSKVRAKHRTSTEGPQRLVGIVAHLAAFLSTNALYAGPLPSHARHRYLHAPLHLLIAQPSISGALLSVWLYTAEALKRRRPILSGHVLAAHTCWL